MCKKRSQLSTIFVNLRSCYRRLKTPRSKPTTAKYGSYALQLFPIRGSKRTSSLQGGGADDDDDDDDDGDDGDDDDGDGGNNEF